MYVSRVLGPGGPWVTRVHPASTCPPTPSRGTFPGAGLSVTQSLSQHSLWGWAQTCPSAEGPTGGAVAEGRWDFSFNARILKEIMLLYIKNYALL